MAKCRWCKREMLKAESCLPTRLYYEPHAGSAVVYDRILNGEEKRGGPVGDQRCHDCNVAPHQYHHPGCDMEECPRCGGQLISCFCHSSGTFRDILQVPPKTGRLMRKSERRAV